jgi:pyruvate dehydrogenase E2 component (dihydrolipoamide acetyltransferase)
VAADKNVDLHQVTGTGPGGRIVKQDVLDHQPAATAASAAGDKAPAALPQRMASGEKKVIELTKMRSTIAQRLQQSKQQVPHFYETIDIEMDALVELRQRMNDKLEKQKIRLSIADFISKAVAGTLQRVPALNATFDGSSITRYGDVNLGIAVALDDGLIVPVLRGVDQMGLAEIRQRSADLIDRARAQRLKRDEMNGATFTISNLGTSGIREFSAIVNPPEVGILAIGSAEQRAVVRNGQIVARTMMTVTLSADHRAVDGAVAAEFLSALRSLLEEPAMMLL